MRAEQAPVVFANRESCDNCGVRQNYDQYSDEHHTSIIFTHQAFRSALR